MLFAEWRAEAKSCSKQRLKQIYQHVADEIMAAITKLEPCEDWRVYSDGSRSLKPLPA